MAPKKNPAETTPPDDALNLGDEPTGDTSATEPQGTGEEALGTVLQGLPPEFKDLEGKDVKTVLAELRKAQKSYDEAHSLIGRQGYELGILKQALQGIPQHPPSQTPQPSPSPEPTGGDDEFDVDKLFSTVKQVKAEVQNLKAEKEKMQAYMASQDVRDEVLAKIPDVSQYREEIKGLASFVDPKYLTDPRSWQMIYLTAKSLKEAAKQFPAYPVEGQFPFTPSATPPPLQPQTPSGQLSQPFGDSGSTQTSGKKPMKIPDEVRKGLRKMVALGFTEVDLEKMLKEEEK